MERRMTGKLRVLIHGILLVLSDFIFSFTWILSGALVKVCLAKFSTSLGSSRLEKEFIKVMLSLIRLFVFAWWGKSSQSGSYNPLPLLFSAISADLFGFLFILVARIPVQVIGSVLGVKLVKLNFPELGNGPRLNVDIHRGPLTEGLLTFVMVIVLLAISKSRRSGFFMKTWMSSLSKLTLHVLGSDFTGACMNPASAMAWAYFRGEHTGKDHLVVYWLAPIEATFLGAWVFKWLVRPSKQEEKMKSE